MKKEYIKPELDQCYNIEDDESIIATSGVKTGDSVEGSYNSNDQTYSKHIDFSDDESIW